MAREKDDTEQPDKTPGQQARAAFWGEDIAGAWESLPEGIRERWERCGRTLLGLPVDD